LVAEVHVVFVKVLVTSDSSESQSGTTRPRTSVDEARHEVIQIVDVTVTVFPPLRVFFVFDVFSGPVPPVPTENKDAVIAECEEVEEFDDIPAVASNSKDTFDASSEDMLKLEDVPPVMSDAGGAFEDFAAVFTLSRVLFVYGVLSEPAPPVVSESRDVKDVAFENM
jgi:hypothetical protein